MIDHAGKYVDSFVIPVPSDRMDEYLELARTASAVWRDHGALEYVECIADDAPAGKITSFPQSVQLKEGETVIFAWIVYESREERDRINKVAMEDPRLAHMDPKTIPFDGMRMFWGGFKVFVSA